MVEVEVEEAASSLASSLKAMFQLPPLPPLGFGKTSRNLSRNFARTDSKVAISPPLVRTTSGLEQLAKTKTQTNSLDERQMAQEVLKSVEPSPKIPTCDAANHLPSISQGKYGGY